jgi:hypothetical protein
MSSQPWPDLLNRVQLLEIRREFDNTQILYLLYNIICVQPTPSIITSACCSDSVRLAICFKGYVIISLFTQGANKASV